MADCEDTRARGEAPLRVRPSGRTITYTGTREQLIAAGIVDADTPFPADPGQRRTFVRFADDDPRRILFIKPASRGRFTVDVRRADADLAAFERTEEARMAEWRRERAAGDAAFIAQSTLDRMCSSFDGYREQQSVGWAAVLRTLIDGLGRPSGGYCYAPELLEEVALHVQAINGLLETGAIVFDAAAREAERARLHAVVARGDRRFDAFMRRARARP